ncbi:hypothetical protein KFE98_07310 [bacterium SCSIO 12741]|nr:hypothetical protein KFE98_07310 [bacterium SCSIO 12741]
MKPFLNSSDLNILTHLFASPEAGIISKNSQDKIGHNETLRNASQEDAPTMQIRVAEDDRSEMRSDYIMDFTSRSGAPQKGYQHKKFYYIKNQDGSMRWVVPQNAKRATFLNFYCSSGMRAKLLAFVWSLAFALKGFRSAFFPSFTVYYKKPLWMEGCWAPLDFESYSFFMGTTGPNRKVVVELNQRGKSTHFVKIPLGRGSQKILENEMSAIRRLSYHSWTKLVFPRHSFDGAGHSLITQNVRPSADSQPTEIGNVHSAALVELHVKSSSLSTLGETAFFQKAKNRMDRLYPDHRIQHSDLIRQCMIELEASLDEGKLIHTSMAHGDFTPWNLYKASNRLHAFDWELSESKMPALFDLFHFVFQSGVLVQRKSYSEIKKTLNKALKTEPIRRLIETHNLDVDLYFKLYLYYQVSYYLTLYAAQEKLHTQVQWLAETWLDALRDVIPLPQEDVKMLFLQDFFGRMANSTYALLKFHENQLEELQPGSDLDILIPKANLEPIKSYLKKYPGVVRARFVDKSFMTTAELHLSDNSFLSLDLLHSFKYKAKAMMNPERMLLTARQEMYGLALPDEVLDFEFVFLFYQLNRADIPAKYRTFFKAFSAKKQDLTIHHLNRKYNLGLENKESLFNASASIRQSLMQTLNQDPRNKGWEGLKNTFNYVVDTFTRLWKNQGMIITFTGVDGAGKSSVIEAAGKRISLELRRPVVVLRHRPSLLPILSAWRYGKQGAEQRSINRLPRTGTNKGTLSSLLRFAYYYTDYVVGQIYVYFKYILPGTIVLYDRYYFDFISDSRRSNLVLPKGLIRALYKFIWKPEVNVLLFASAQEILKRKQELTENVITRLTQDYQSLFHDLAGKNSQSKFLQIENVNLDATVEQVVQEVRTF